MYLNKPVMMVPVKGHYEQYCNARDASRIGAGIYCEEFDLSKLEECFLFYNKEKNEHFRTWVNSVESQLVRTVEDMFPTAIEPKSQNARILSSFLTLRLSVLLTLFSILLTQ
jgi:hypothetical protein